MVYNSEGKESEWNEATFKSKRLNDIQELINYFKMNPQGITDGKFNYIWYLKNVEALYGEGQSKYKPKEKTECERLQTVCNKLLKLMPPHIPILNHSLAGHKLTYIFSLHDFEELIKLIYEFEMKVKDLNDIHGLTTKNKGKGGMF